MCPQLLAGATTEEKTAWRLGPPADFCYTNQSGCDTVAGMSDAAELVATRNAFGTLGVGDSVQEPVFRVIAAILHLGNVIFSGGEGESMTQVENEEQVRAATPTARGVAPVSHVSPLWRCMLFSSPLLRRCSKWVPLSWGAHYEPRPLAQAAVSSASLSTECTPKAHETRSARPSTAACLTT